MARLLLVSCALVLVGCGDNAPEALDAGPPDSAPLGDIRDRLAALPGVTVEEWTPPPDFQAEPGYRYFDLLYTQPIDHLHPDAGSFQQYVAVMHKDVAAPLVIYTSGYDAGWTRYLTEPATLLEGNQVSFEYRFYGQSRPTGAVDYSKLTVSQNMADEHAIIVALAGIYQGHRIETGGSKGGENALAHLQFYPDDLHGVVAYVPPVITDNPDLRYATVLDDIGIPACRTKLRAIQREMLSRRAAMQTAASAQDAYTRAGVAHATETAIVELEFSFWMTRGEADCGQVPDPSATDDVLFGFLVQTGGPAGYSDAALATSGEQYIYQDQAELGYPIWEHAHLDDLMQFSYEDWSAYMPLGTDPTYDPAQPRSLAAWLAQTPERFAIVGGEWDPWGAGYPPVASGHDALDLRVFHGSHWSSGIYSLGAADQAAAIAALRRWAGLPAAKLAPAMRIPRASMASRGPR